MIDMDSLMKGQDYTELKESYVLFICKQDPFFSDEQDKTSYGLPRYSFKNICLENTEVKLNDKSLKVIYNSSAYESEKDEKIRAFLQYVSTNEPGKDDFTNRLSKLVEKIKDNEKFRSDYAAMNLHDRDIQRTAKEEGRKEGLEAGAQQKAIEAATNLLKMNVLSSEQIAQASGLPLEKILELKAQMDNSKV